MPRTKRRAVKEYSEEVCRLYSAAEAVYAAYRWPNSGQYDDLRGMPFHNLIELLSDAMTEVNVPMPPAWSDLYYVTAVVEFGRDRGRIQVMAGPYAHFAQAADCLPAIKKLQLERDPHESYGFWSVTGTNNVQARFITPRYPVDVAALAASE